MNAIPADTTVDAAMKQFEILRKLSTNERAEMTFQLNNNLRQTLEAGIRYRHPDYDDETVKKAVLRLTIGRDLFRRIFGNAEVQV